jgi:predicted ribosome quality control (RQC) complex YloA/Tae2 family protein
MNPKKIQRFTSFLRAHVRGGRIIHAYQLGCERIVKVEVKKDEKILWIWIRLWGGSANMIVTDSAGTVLDACYRRPRRGEMSGGYYNPEKTLGEKSGRENKDQYRIRDLPGDESFNEKIEHFFFEKEDLARKEKLINTITLSLNEREIFFISQLEKIEKQKAEYENFARFKELGDIITSNLHAIRKGDKWLETTDFFNSNRKINIELDPNLYPQDNAEKYYDRYKGAKKGLQLLEEREHQIQKGLQAIERKRALLRNNTDIDTLLSLVRTTVKRRQKTPSTMRPGVTFYSSGFQIVVGKTGSDNDMLLRKYMRGNDYWFHVRDNPGAYVFIKSVAGKSIPLQTMLDAGNLALFYSKGKDSGKGDVYYTQVKYLRRVKQGKKGMVIPTQEKNLYIILDVKRIEKLKNSKPVY